MTPSLRRRPLDLIHPTVVLTVLFLITITAACRRVNEITVSPPQSPDTQDARTSDGRGSVVVELRMSTTPLPPYLYSTRFRITEIHFRPEAGDWVRRLSDRTAFIADDAQRSVHTLLRTEIPVTRYDSLSVFLSDVFVQFSEHAGGPVSVKGNPVTIPIDLTPASTRLQTVVLLYDPATSVSLDTSASFPQWHFSGTFTVGPDTAAAPPR